MQLTAPLEVVGLSIHVWWDAWRNCHTRLQDHWVRLEWPDGCPYAEQPHYVVQIFEWITSEMYRMQPPSSLSS